MRKNLANETIGDFNEKTILRSLIRNEKRILSGVDEALSADVWAGRALTAE